MTGTLIAPPDRLTADGPLVFLAGPIQGAADWQRQAAAFLRAAAPDLHVANPRHDLPSGAFSYEAQVDWETYHLRRAAATGAILFWLAREAEHFCERAYGQTSRFELAEWKVRHERDSAQLVVGIEEGFSGARYIRRRFAQDCPRVPLVASLEDACRAAVELARAPLTSPP
jgi:hypothetical protein